MSALHLEFLWAELAPKVSILPLDNVQKGAIVIVACENRQIPPVEGVPDNWFRHPRGKEMNSHDEAWGLAHRHAHRLADVAYGSGNTKEEKARLYFVTYNTFMQTFAREDSERARQVCPECGNPTQGTRCARCEGV